MKRPCLLTFVVFLVCQSVAGAVEPTPLSQKAAQLKYGMSRTAVIDLLGNPDWASIPGDSGDYALPDPSFGLELRWRNAGCSSVAVLFNLQQRVNGWDEGRLCVKGVEELEPNANYACSKSDRKRYCENK